MPHSLPQSLDPEKQDEHQDSTKHSVYKSLGWLDRLLVVWILLAIIIGILLGNFVESVGPALQKGKFVNVSVPIGMLPCMSLFSPLILAAIGLLVMMYPILCKVKYETLHHVFRERAVWVQIGFSIVINWLVAPLLMVSLRRTGEAKTDRIARPSMGFPPR